MRTKRIDSKERQKMIDFLKKVQTGQVKPLDGEGFSWDKRSGFWQCSNEKFKHLRLTDQQIDDFIEKYGGRHLLFDSFEDTRDEPIQDTESTSTQSDTVFRWHETKVYVDEPQPEAITVPTPPNELIIVPEPAKKPKQPKKKRVASKPQLTRAEANKIKAKADYQKCLAQMELDKQRMENMNEFNRINKEFFQ
jgi:hypothetical protein